MNKQRFFITLVSSIIIFSAVTFTALNDFSLFTEMVIIFLSVVIGQAISIPLFRRFAEQRVSNQTVFVSFLSMLVILWTFAGILFD
ncbi:MULTISPECIES: hypothetical protein [unclassified Exiguobacterium]|uniref:hypothetical protein n=1 Tax=unclassified Exiguobacterium TaxID=2644629 RepID=UPI001BE6B779|nr:MULTISPECIES: hypothetical protein [unclassified Exiguobacterium]